MNNLYEQYIYDEQGRKYRYDPDYDCYYRVHDTSNLGHMQQFGWIYATAILCAVCYYVEFIL